MMGFVYRYDDKVIVIDGGTREDYPELLKIIKKCGSVIDLLVVTHCHHDHIGALTLLLKNEDVQVKEIIFDFPSVDVIKSILRTDWEKDIVEDFLKIVEERKIPRFVPELKKEYFYGKMSLKFWKLGDIHHNDINDSSLVFTLKTPSKTILFTGDISPKMSDLIAEQYCDSKALKCDYVQLAHHGQSGGSFDLYKLTNAKYALWCAPKWLFDNDAGAGPESGPYTSKVTKEWLSELNIESITAFDKTVLINQKNIKR